MASFYLGEVNTARLGVFRGVASTFFVFYIMQKWIEFPWENIQFAVFGGGLLFTSICLFAKENPSYFSNQNLTHLADS
jgi:hypothetical protein